MAHYLLIYYQIIENMSISSQPLQTYNKINKLINLSRFNESFLLLRNNMILFESLQNDIEILKNTEAKYKYMLDYIAEGNDDPSAPEVLEQLRESLYHANDLLLKETLLYDSSTTYASVKRMFNLKKVTFSSLLEDYNNVIGETLKNQPEEADRIITISQSQAIINLFNYVWTFFGSNAEEYEKLNNFLLSTQTPDYLKALLVSAIVMENLSFFDADSFEIIINQYETTESPIVKARSMMGIILLSLLYSNRINNNINLRSRLLILGEDEVFSKLTNDVLLLIIKTFDTKRIDDKMRNEVIPGLMKIKPEIMDKMRNLAAESENFLSDENPDWEKMFENSGISDKLQEINNMQMDGADVMITAFSNLKGFPFFNQVANWFLPFVPGYYEYAVLGLDSNDEALKILSTMMCDSDINSFFLSLGGMMYDKRDLMLSNLKSQISMAHEALMDSINDPSNLLLSNKIRHSLQDLYRFFNYFRKKDEFQNPFQKPVVSSDIDSLQKLVNISTENIKIIAEFYFKNKYFQEALGFYEMIDRIEPGDFKTWEKIAYCYDKLLDFPKAIEWYSKAELVNPGNFWLEKRLAVTLKNAGHYDKAFSYYEKILDKDPDNYHLLMSAGQCLLSGGKPEESLKYFYHANYLKPEKIDAQRAVAWAELMSRNFDKAIKQYEKILNSENSDKSDILNAAHASLASKDFKTALILYKSFLKKINKNDTTELVLAFKEDNETFKILGIKSSDLRLIVDKIRYDFIS